MEQHQRSTRLRRQGQLVERSPWQNSGHGCLSYLKKWESCSFAVGIASSGTSLGPCFARCFRLGIWKALMFSCIRPSIYLCLHRQGAQLRPTVLFSSFFSPPILSDLLPSSTLTLLSFPTPSTAFHSALPFTQSSPPLIHATQAVSSAGPDNVLHITSEMYSSSGKYDPIRVTKPPRVSCLTKLSVPK